MKLAAFLAAAIVAAACPARAQTAEDLDGVFGQFSSSSAGCAVGLDRPGEPPLTRAWGMADLEHGVANTPETIFESGSVAKQFTAAAILMLAREGKLKLTDDVRKHLPELWTYPTPVSIEQLLNHLGGLRDWGDVAQLGGWPRTTRAYTNEEALAIAYRQRALNYAPGSEYAYTNTGYILAAEVVRRVSGQTLSQFTQARIFKPLGMTRTQWRDDFRRIVPDRAIAYRAGPYQDMPFESAYGHGGLLTTVGDLLIWNRALAADALLPGLYAEMQVQAVLTGGRKVAYARGVWVEQRLGRKEVAHSGSTAGYRAWLAHYPESGVSVAVLCNTAEADAVGLGRRIADFAILPPEVAEEVASPTSVKELEVRPGVYLDERTGQVGRIVRENGTLRLSGGPLVYSEREASYRLGADRVIFTPEGYERRFPNGDISRFRRLTRHAHTPAELTAAAGVFTSDEAQATLRLSFWQGKLILQPADRPSYRQTLEPLDRDTFIVQGGVVRLIRDAQGQVEALRFTTARVRDLRFRRSR
ncbi:beta-lactamase family protein [Phenylobacterium sp. J426]|uniref:serine hydrolase domain-containing protein n=1 Tax=Phenylobacterium sp. J426 TaxID=2898439 RepID=UPI002151A943|nr:serine hydrolase domain-containing protein [Phenylobacterium sp. J426]MCR5874590.1 beta-lactamase family protein [Phenylobacterium sp. J426]